MFDPLAIAIGDLSVSSAASGSAVSTLVLVDENPRLENFPETGTVVGTMEVSGGALPITYSITSGEDSSRFIIDEPTGELSFAVSPDFELPSDDDLNNVYEVVIRATDNVGNYVELTWVITVTNVAAPGDNEFKIATASPVWFYADGEHIVWFNDVKTKTNWLVGHTPQVVALHETGDRDCHYREYRRRTNPQDGFAAYRGFLQTTANKPNIVLLGVGHSGTTIASKILAALGWKVPHNDEEYYEDSQARSLNRQWLRGGSPNFESYVRSLTGPWLIKDPRMVVTLDQWYSAFAALPEQPLLIGIRRNMHKVLQSYARRNQNPEVSHGGYSVKQLSGVYRRQFTNWPWAKVEIRYEDLAAAAKLFEQGR